MHERRCGIAATIRASRCHSVSFLPVLPYVEGKVSSGTPYLASGASDGAPKRNIQERQMSKSIKALGLVSLLVLVAACGNNNNEEFVVVDPEPISQEPVHTGKFK